MPGESTSSARITLLLMRHGKSDWNAGATDDISRPLNHRGVKASGLMGEWLRENGLIPDAILASPAVRSRETARIVAEKTGYPEARIVLEERLYLSGVAQHLEVLQSTGVESGALLLIGHNPGIEELLDALCMNPPPTPKNGKMMPTAAVAVLHLTQALEFLQPGKARLEQLVRPRELAG